MPNLFDANPYMPHDGQQQQDPQAAPQTGSVPPAQGAAIPAADGASTGASSANPFDANPYIPKQQEPQDEGAFMAAVDGFNRQFGRMAESGIRGFESVTGLGDKKNLDTYINGQNLQAAQGAMNHPYSAGLGSVLGGLGVGTYGLLGAAGVPSMLSAGAAKLGLGTATAYGLPSTFPGMMALNTGMGGGMAAAGEYGDPSSTPDSIGMSGLKGAATAAGFTAAAGIATPAIRGLSNMAYKAVNPKGAALGDLASQVEDSGGLSKMVANGANADALGVPQTPSEVMGKGPIKDWEMQQLQKDPNNMVGNFANTRNVQIRNLANDTANQFTPQGLEAARAANDKAYEGLKNLSVPPEKILGSNKATNTLIQDELAKMNTDKYSAYSDVSDGSVYKLDKLKQDIDKKIYATKDPLTQPEYKLNESQLPTYQQASSDIKNIIDEHHPDTAGIRQNAQRAIFQQRINDQLDNFKASQQDHGVPTLDAMYDKIWSGNKTNNFLDAVKESGGDVDNAQKVINLMRDTYQNNVNKVSGQSNLNMADSAKSAAQPGWISKIVDHTVNRPYEKAMVQLLLSPDWKEQVAQAISPKSDQGKLMGLSNLIGKVAKSTAKSYANGEVRQGLGIDSGVAPSIVPSISSQLAPAFVRGVTNLPPAGLLAAPIGAGVLQAQDYPVVQGLGTVGYTMGNSLMHPLRTLGFDK